MARRMLKAVLAGAILLSGVNGSSLRKGVEIHGRGTSNNDGYEDNHASVGFGRATQAEEEDRVSQLDNNGVDCMAGAAPDPDAEIGMTVIKYYYAVEANEAITTGTIRKLERRLFYTISASLLWCFKRNDPPIGVGNGNRLLEEILENPDFLQFHESRRALSAAEARRLSILSVNSAPPDDELEIQCGHDFEDRAFCTVYEGYMTIVSHDTDGVGHVVASILDATQEAMDMGLLLGATIPEVSKVKWLGETIEEAINGGPIVIVPGGDGTEGGSTGGDGGVGGAGGTGGDGGDGSGSGADDSNPDGVRGGDLNGNDGDLRVRTVFAVSIPLLLLLFLGFFLAKTKRQAHALTHGQARALGQRAVYGTGDPPRSFHEGLFHYTRGGARYLSTSCPDCIATRRNGFFTQDDIIADLATITEGEEYDPALLSGSLRSSYDEFSMGTEGSELHGERLVTPSSKDLGGRHSGMDVHNCASATCAICKLKANDVAFVPSPKAQSRATGFTKSSHSNSALPDRQFESHSLDSREDQGLGGRTMI